MEHVYISDNVVFLPGRDPLRASASYRVTHPGQLQMRESVDWLNANSMRPLELPEELLQKIRSGCARAVNMGHPAAQSLIDRPWDIPAGKLRVHVLAMGDVGATLLLGLVLLGGDVISSIGICDMREHVLRRYEYEMNQIAWPFAYDDLPSVQSVPPQELFDCDAFVFCASRAVPPVGTAVGDVRMAQLQGNTSILKAYARQAREADFHGLFAVVSDPVDLLSQYALLESNRDEAGSLDWHGLLPEQIRGYGLGVMNARAAFYAKRESRFESFLTQGRAYGPHGKGLIIANSIEAYNDALSLELTRLAMEANLRMREAGFKPYIAPALSSGALSILLTLRREWHYSAIFLDGVYFGCKNRQSSMGIETEALSLPPALHERIRQEHAMLWEQGSQWRT